MKAFALATAFVLLSVSAVAHDVDGKWSGTMNTPNGDVTVNFSFKADGATLTGSTAGPDGAEIKIADGKVDGKNVSFSVTFDFGGMPFTMGYKGIVSPTEIKFTLDIFGMPLELTVKKTT